MDRETEIQAAGSSENLQKRKGPQMYEEETKNLRFINVEAEHQFLLKLQKKDLNATEEWLNKYPGGISFKD
jgi:hypothetical protein